MRVLDLFSGMGGLSYGFQKAMYTLGIEAHMTLVDNWKYALESAKMNLHAVHAETLKMDLRNERPGGKYDVVIGGPPCRPWSALNHTKRGKLHGDYSLVRVFFETVHRIKPVAFVMENVPFLAGDPIFTRSLQKMLRSGYSVQYGFFRYSEFGATTKRKRLITVGILNGKVDDVFKNLAAQKEPPGTVRKAIWDLREKRNFPDHEWINPRTISRYMDKYRTGKFGWYFLNWDSPAPSFGNINKTYILHPDGNRVISVREAMRIMGFDDGYVFPESVPVTAKYQMIADAVSPVFSEKLGVVLIDSLEASGMVEKQQEKISLEI